VGRLTLAAVLADTAVAAGAPVAFPPIGAAASARALPAIAAGAPVSTGAPVAA
jgi:hypothetical protein